MNIDPAGVIAAFCLFGLVANDELRGDKWHAFLLMTLGFLAGVIVGLVSNLLP